MSKSPLHPTTAKQMHGAVAAAVHHLDAFERYGRIVSLMADKLFEAMEKRHLLRAAVGADEVARTTFVRARLELADTGLSPETAASLARVLGQVLGQLQADAYPVDSDSWRLRDKLRRREQAVWKAAVHEYYRRKWSRR